jgi:phage shock protein PspC (stress-responsive transcriptional regulator)
MDKTININISGTLFQIDEEAFRILRDYLQSINNRFKNVQGGHETIEDIESRIAEIFQSQKGLAGVISRENVEAMISIIGKPEDFDQAQNDEDQQFRQQTKKRMYRNPDDKIIAGVCSGLGAYLDVDPVLFRVLFVIFTAFFGTGFLIYIVLWVALPEANTETKKRELFGVSYHSASSRNQKYDTYYNSSSQGSDSYSSGSAIGNAINEIFRAIGKVFYVIFRIFMIFIGLIFVLTGFLAIVAFLMIFVFKMPWAFSATDFDPGFVYLPDLLNYVFNPSLTPWIIVLAILSMLLPLLAFIYWGVKMIFWFKANDWLLSLVASVIWVMSVTALAIIMFNQGISFKENGRTTTQTILPGTHDTIYVMTDHKIADLKYSKKFFPDDYTIFLVDSSDMIYIRPELKLTISENDFSQLEIRKRSSGITRSEAALKSESLIYNYKVAGDTIYLDDYFAIPSGKKWSADFVTLNLYVPEKSVLYFDKSVEKLFHNSINITKVEGDTIYHSSVDYDTEPWELGGKYWSISEEGLKEVGQIFPKQK